MAEMLALHRKEIDRFSKKSRMTDREIGVDALVEVRERLVETIYEVLDERDKAFLYSSKMGDPD